MADWNKGQWSQPQQGYVPVGPNPGYAPQYAPTYEQPPPQGQVYGDSKDPYEGDRFKPKKTINDPVFLTLFIIQVSERMSTLNVTLIQFHCDTFSLLPLLDYLDTC